MTAGNIRKSWGPLGEAVKNTGKDIDDGDFKDRGFDENLRERR